MAFATTRLPWYRSRVALAIAGTFLYLAMWCGVLFLSVLVGLSSESFDSMLARFFGVVFYGGLVGHGLWVVAVRGLLPPPRRIERILVIGLATPVVVFATGLSAGPIPMLVTAVVAPFSGTAWAYGPALSGRRPSS